MVKSDDFRIFRLGQLRPFMLTAKGCYAGTLKYRMQLHNTTGIHYRFRSNIISILPNIHNEFDHIVG